MKGTERGVRRILNHNYGRQAKREEKFMDRESAQVNDEKIRRCREKMKKKNREVF